MNKNIRRTALALSLAAGVFASAAQAAFPTDKPVTLVVPFAAGCRLAAGFGCPFHCIAGLSAQPGVLDFDAAFGHCPDFFVLLS